MKQGYCSHLLLTFGKQGNWGQDDIFCFTFLAIRNFSLIFNSKLLFQQHGITIFSLKGGPSVCYLHTIQEPGDANIECKHIFSAFKLMIDNLYFKLIEKWIRKHIFYLFSSCPGASGLGLCVETEGTSNRISSLWHPYALGLSFMTECKGTSCHGKSSSFTSRK